MSASVFDPDAESQTELALSFATVEQLGCALAARCATLAAAVDDAEKTAQDSEDILLVAGAAAMARYSADSAGDCAQAVTCLIGKGDLKLTNGCLHLAQRARRHAERVERYWAQLKARKGAAA